MVKGCDRYLVVPTASETKFHNGLLKLGLRDKSVDKSKLRSKRSHFGHHSDNGQIKL